MARPKIGIFGALMALGGYLAVRYVQRSRAAQPATARELNRWEDEGGAVVTPSASSTAQAGRSLPASAGPGAHGPNGSAHPDAWPFPHSS
ncbi:hypothetical protein [Paraburkholderia phenoliruptrix]|uniref:hypothetical protein n=1 Tax=Paraburkholderia phenoliruptrix TaxID=252970 RepID=UPI001C6F44BB|nr:hypothetical protein [Paraburkholderia phenoliruptrix]MBW9105703.1 hypothetical protein [Paraburkholderia phenoliruptrix]MBW9130410.1 hypothetical protein [Paraburkholderia ginsengiterrae]